MVAASDNPGWNGMYWRPLLDRSGQERRRGGDDRPAGAGVDGGSGCRRSGRGRRSCPIGGRARSCGWCAGYDARYGLRFATGIIVSGGMVRSAPPFMSWMFGRDWLECATECLERGLDGAEDGHGRRSTGSGRGWSGGWCRRRWTWAPRSSWGRRRATSRRPTVAAGPPESVERGAADGLLEAVGGRLQAGQGAASQRPAAAGERVRRDGRAAADGHLRGRVGDRGAGGVLVRGRLGPGDVPPGAGRVGRPEPGDDHGGRDRAGERAGHPGGAARAEAGAAPGQPRRARAAGAGGVEGAGGRRCR